jgi:hypothetical protein
MKLETEEREAVSHSRSHSVGSEYNIQGVTGGLCETSGECSLC